MQYNINKKNISGYHILSCDTKSMFLRNIASYSKNYNDFDVMQGIFIS